MTDHTHKTALLPFFNNLKNERFKRLPDLLLISFVFDILTNRIVSIQFLFANFKQRHFHSAFQNNDT